MIAFNNNEYLGEQPQPEPVGRLPRIAVPVESPIVVPWDGSWMTTTQREWNEHKSKMDFIAGELTRFANMPEPRGFFYTPQYSP